MHAQQLEVLAVLGGQACSIRAQLEIKHIHGNGERGIKDTPQQKQKYEHYYTQRPEVGSLGIISGQHFGGQVVTSANSVVHFVCTFQILPGESKVNQFDLCILFFGIKDEVFKFQISVSNVVQMQVVQGTEHLANQKGSVGFGELGGGLVVELVK